MPYQTIPCVLLEGDLRPCPHISVAGKLMAPASSRLPSQEDGAVRGALEICPVEWGRVAGDLGGLQEPFGDFRQVDPRHRCISVGRQQMHMGKLLCARRSACLRRETERWPRWRRHTRSPWTFWLGSPAIFWRPAMNGALLIQWRNRDEAGAGANICGRYRQYRLASAGGSKADAAESRCAMGLITCREPSLWSLLQTCSRAFRELNGWELALALQWLHWQGTTAAAGRLPRPVPGFVIT